MNDTDVLIVGAGPAGSAAALVLARAGIRVRLLDRARFPRHKLCGDTMNPGTLAILDRLGVGGAVRPRTARIEGMVVSGPGGTSVTADYPGRLSGGSLARRDLDQILVETACAAGARFDDGVGVRGPLMADEGHRLRGVRVAVDGVERDLLAPVVIAADGRHSRLAFGLGLASFVAAPRRWAFGAYFTDVAGMTPRGEMHVRPDGYVGLAPMPDGLTNVCVVRELSQTARRAGWTAAGVIDTAVSADVRLRDRFERARQVSEVVVLGPLGVESHAAGLPGLLLAGDAAGFIDPMTGDGLRFALSGGELAAAAALRELASGEPAHRSLGRARRREFRAKWRVNRALRWLAGSPRGLGVAASVAGRWTAPIEYLVGVAGDVSLTR